MLSAKAGSMESQLEHLFPPLFSHGELDAFAGSGRGLAVASSPRDSGVAVYAFPSDLEPSTVSSEDGEEILYFANFHQPPAPDRRLFLTDSSVIFAAAQNLLKTQPRQHTILQDDPARLAAVRKLSIDYVNFIKECWVHTSSPSTPKSNPEGESSQYSADHYRILYSCFSLFVTLYLPDPEFEDAPVGDELMEWLNIHFIAPSTEEGDLLSTLENPWEDDNFWPYLTRTTLRGLSKASTFFLKSLARHPSLNLQRLTEALIPLLESHPRLQNFSSERDFVIAARRWKDRVKSIRMDLDRIPEDDRHDGFVDWWDSMSDLVGILEGRQEVIQRVCEELGADWREVCCVWGVFVDTRLRRQDLPDVLADVQESQEVDSVEDLIHSALMSGQTEQVLEIASGLDPWLSAHLADLMEAVGLLTGDINEESGLTIREHYVLSYAEYLHSDPALWRITVDYMCCTSDLGKARADEVLVRVPLRLRTAHSKRADEMAEQESTNNALTTVLKELNRTCFEYGREEARRTICKIAARTSIEQEEYGVAVSYCQSADDWIGLGHIVDRVLEEYIERGAAKLVSLVFEIAPLLQELQRESGPPRIFIHRLMFAVRYAEFHDRCLNDAPEEAANLLIGMFDDELPPKSWWAVLLYDAMELLQHPTSILFTTAGVCELLKRMQEIGIRSGQGLTREYMSVLTRLSKEGGEVEAHRKLDAVRLALARFYARCTVGRNEGREQRVLRGTFSQVADIVVI